MRCLTAADFRAWAATLPPPAPVPPLRGVLLVRPDGFALSPIAAGDNRYMGSGVVDPERALAEHAAVVDLLTSAGITTTVVPGDPALPDACFPNNALATLPGGTAIYGRLRHPDRQGEPQRPVLREAVAGLGYATHLDWSADPTVIAELTGSLVIDHARNIGYLGMSERMNGRGAELMAAHWNLAGIFQFDLAPSEYHTNVVLAVLAGRGCVIAREGFAEPAVPEAIAALYGGQVLWLTPDQHTNFAGNILALGESHVALSRRAADALGPAGLATLESWGFELLIAPIPELEKGGGSMRCLLCELW